jgi:hypothetical protein
LARSKPASHASKRSLRASNALGVAEVAGDVVEVLGEPVPLVAAAAEVAELADAVPHHLPVTVVREGATSEADDVEVLRQAAFAPEVEQRGQQLALGQVAGGPCDNDGGGFTHDCSWPA